MIKNLPGLFIFSALLLTSTSIWAQKSNIKVTDFNLSTIDQKVIIDWKTVGTISINYFTIQKSEGDSYGCMDKVTDVKNSYYRPVHIDTNGNEQINEAKLLAKP